MKKLLPILMVVSLFVTACQLGGGSAGQPTAIVLPQDESQSNADAGETRNSAADGMIEVFIPAATFTMGGVDPRAASDEMPIHQVQLNAFWFDKVEVTNGMYAVCVKSGTCRLPLSFKSQTRSAYYGDPQYADYPVVYVTWLEAKTYCEWAGRRLPTEAEWERAARGDDSRSYPWGDQIPDASRANFSNLIGDTAKVGNSPAGASSFGILDMAGNAAEWTRDIYQADYYGSGLSINPQGPGELATIFNHVVRGGSFQDVEADIRVSKRASVLGSNPNALIDSVEWLGTYSPKIGFRCASGN
ncbi:MAG: SUMF1/EgtB/PvdO family nonheme iron enzyme [Chloroflexi bacterium]|nr:SUMF1/EgtB/PvdO family nonheme iron enzyme [Chloroflexota bacterium]